MDGLKKRATFYPNFFALRRTQNGSVKFNLVLLFVFSIFLLSNDETFKIASMNASSIVAMLMVLVFLLDGFGRGRFVLQRHSFQKPLLLLFLWALISLLISKIDPSKAVPDESYSYVWATGLNSPDWRGVSFLLRLFLSIFAINFIISNVNTEERYFKVINYFIFAYFLLCSFVIIQIIFYGVFNIEVGHILPSRFEGYFPVGGYVGESGTLAGMLVSGYFVLFMILKLHKYAGRMGFFLKLVFIMASVDLIFTFSAAWITAVLLTFLIFVRKSVSKKNLFIGIALLIFAISLSDVFREVVILRGFAEIMSASIRTYSWIAGLNIFRDYPIAGTGIGQSVFFMPTYLEMDITNFLITSFNPELYTGMRFPPMNTYIQWMAETGFVGLLLLVRLIYCFIKYGKAFKKVEYYNLVKYGFGGGLLAVVIAMNAGPDNLYVGYINFLVAMYISGINLFSGNAKEGKY